MVKYGQCHEPEAELIRQYHIVVSAQSITYLIKPSILTTAPSSFKFRTKEKIERYLCQRSISSTSILVLWIEIDRVRYECIYVFVREQERQPYGETKQTKATSKIL